MENDARKTQLTSFAAIEEEEDFFSDFALETDGFQGADELDLEDAELLEELSDDDLIDDVEDEFILSPAQGYPPAADGDLFGEGKNPISTITLAELYVSQGFLKRALTIYRELLETDPDNAELKKRLYALKQAIDEDTANARNSLLAGGEAVAEFAAEAAGVPPSVPEAGGAVGAVMEDRVIATLESWLDNIRRRR